MNQFDYRAYYKRKLPHYQPIGYKFFITFRLAGSLPKHLIQELHQEKERMKKLLEKINNLEQKKQLEYEHQRRWFAKYDSYLDQATAGPRWLGDPRIAELVAMSIKHRDGKVYALDAFSIMPNHAHLVGEPLICQNVIPANKQNGQIVNLPCSLAKIMHSLKRYTATQANLILGKTGEQFWQHENYDHAIRDEAEFGRIIQYVLNNPVKAGLVDSWEKWPWSYYRA